jgi:hypothetical protein
MTKTEDQIAEDVAAEAVDREWEAFTRERHGEDDEGREAADDGDYATEYEEPEAPKPTPLDLLTGTLANHAQIAGITITVLDRRGQVHSETAGASLADALLMAEVTRQSVLRHIR